VIVVQMHGEPGSGKTTLAAALAARLPALHLDKDVISSALMRSGIAAEAQGPGAYESLRSLAASFLAQGHSVVLDSPCFWPGIEESGRALAARFSAPWCMIECQSAPAVVEHRLATRPRLESNPTQRGAGAGRPGMYTPTCERLTLDSTSSLESLVSRSLAYVVKQCPAFAAASGLGTQASELPR
jgi:predicted kinase